MSTGRKKDPGPAPWPEASCSWRDVAPPAADELHVVVGPTASGKTELAIRLAESFGGEIIGADSVQIYRGFDVGSGKPTAAERAAAPHHLVDCVEPDEPFEAQRFADLAELAIADIRRRGKVPIVCGGAFLWVRALVLGLAPAPPADPGIRARHDDVARERGRAALHAELAAVDAVAAARLAPNDFVRVSRALEVHELTGRPQSVWHAEHGFRVARHQARYLGVARSREELHERITARAEGWLERGWIDEVRALRAAGHGRARAMSSVGYRQVSEHLDGIIAAPVLTAEIARATRVFVRRQRTWIRDESVLWTRP